MKFLVSRSRFLILNFFVKIFYNVYSIKFLNILSTNPSCNINVFYKNNFKIWQKKDI